MKNSATKVDQWAESYRSGTDGELKAAIKTFYNMKAWHELHIALWVWLAMDGKREKEEWFNFFNVPKNLDLCFACSCAAEVLRGAGEMWFPSWKAACHFCPLPRDVYKIPSCANGLYAAWMYTPKKTEREELAREIAVMKWEEKQ